MQDEECWAVETSKDGERWRFFGKGWKAPGEPMILHAVPRYVRFRRLVPEETKEWSDSLESDSGLPMTLLRMEEGVREDLWLGEEHQGLPVLLAGGEEGRLLRFDHDEDGMRWTWALEFRGERAR